MSDQLTGGSLPHLALRALADADGPLPPAAVRDRVPAEMYAANKDVNTALSRLHDRGLVERTVAEDGPTGPRFHYAPTDAGRAALEAADA